MNISDAELDQLLFAIEQTELTSLRWGYVEGSLSDERLQALARATLSKVIDDDDYDSIVQAMLERGLLRELRQSSGAYAYRSRFAESVRLLRDLKLLTPKRPWNSAPNLVSDFRVDARSRKAPRRDVLATEALTSLGLSGPTTGVAGIRSELASALLGITDAGDESLRLSAFQVRTAQAVLAQHQSSRGVVVSAGTGSGKTLAFYLPALIEVGQWVEKNEHWTKALALYPRIELLKDQFSEAYRLARKLDAPLKRRGRRPITIGAFFSLTPSEASVEAVQQVGWEPVGSVAFLCPFLVCPVCGSELVWLRSDLKKPVERLVCQRMPHCGGVVTSDQVTLTRDRAVTQPPDMLFTTAAMLNQRLSDTKRRAVFGITSQPNRRVRLALLDEIHTYTGTTGAQTALVLRRWRHAVERPLRIVGLSATLREAGVFFAQLTGLAPTAITEVAPSDDELDRLSGEYQLILRGDPVSQTSLLSTSIQAAYLLARLLDAPVDQGVNHAAISSGRYGSRAFVFTDDLDVVNRFFDDLRDAEGYDVFGRPRPGRQPLSALRASTQPEAPRRDSAGQLWKLCENIGRDPTQRLRVTRTSSQDAGVSASSDLIIATSALEVGFDDPTVGAVLQHKAPLDMASFLQRKGRAGRRMRMRPWMVTVLSDYGRDRLAYQEYEQLFDPVLPSQQLPIRNEYILRMQAVFAFIDWLADHNEHAHQPQWWWATLNGPDKDGSWLRKQQIAALKTVRALLHGDVELRASLTTHLVEALQLPEDTVRRLLWEPPRSLFLEALPTLDRRLTEEWAIPATPERPASDDLMALPPAVHPLPDFVPANLFSDLNLPEVSIQLPPATKQADERRELMPIAQTLRQLAPGRVTRRFAYERGGLSHWIPVPLESGTYLKRIREFAPHYEFVASVQATIDGEVQQIPCYRPSTVAVSLTPQNVSASSNAFLEWSSQLIPRGEGLPLTIHDAHGWSDVITQAVVHLHRFRSPITTRRYALGARATVRVDGLQDDQRVRTRFVADDGGPAAIGFEQEVDGLCIRLHLPSPADFAARAAQSPEVSGWRSAYFRDRILGDEELGAFTNEFQRDWLYQIYLSALVAHASRQGSTLAQAHEAMHTGDPQHDFQTVMSGIFQLLSENDVERSERWSEEEEEERGIHYTIPRGRLEQRLTDLLQNPIVLRRLEALATEIWAPTAERWAAWLTERIHETVGQALLLACAYMAPRHANTETLLLDLDRGLQPRDESEATTLDGVREVWITESVLGGGGVVEAIAKAVSEEPIIFSRALAAALAPRETELTSDNLDRFMRLALSDYEVGAAIEQVRRMTDHQQRDKARDQLYALLARRGLSVDHALSVALNHRLLRAGTDATSDRLIADMLVAWKQIERRYGIAIDVRVACYLLATDPAFEARIRDLMHAITGAAPTVVDMVGSISGMLWPRAVEVRTHAFAGFTPFREQGFTDPALARELLLTEQIAEVQFDQPDWLAQFEAALTTHWRVRLLLPRETHAEEQLRHALARILATPINVDYLQFFPLIEEVKRDEGITAVTLILRELV